MNCTEVTEKLPWLLNQSLAGAERGEMIAHLRGCESCRRELNETSEFMDLAARHPAPDRIASYVFESGLDESERKSISDHVAHCESCRQEVQLAGESRKMMPQARSSWLRAIGIAALLLLSVSLGMLWRNAEQRTQSLEMRTRILEDQTRALNRPTARVRILDLLPDGQRDRSTQSGQNLRILPTDLSQTTLLLNSQIAMDRTGCSIRLSREDTVLWQADQLERGASGEFAIHIPHGFLTKGAYRVLLECAGAGERYSFSVE